MVRPMLGPILKDRIPSKEFQEFKMELKNRPADMELDKSFGKNSGRSMGQTDNVMKSQRDEKKNQKTADQMKG